MSARPLPPGCKVATLPNGERDRPQLVAGSSMLDPGGQRHSDRPPSGTDTPGVVWTTEHRLSVVHLGISRRADIFCIGLLGATKC